MGIERTLNENAIVESLGFYNIFEDLHQKYFTQGNAISLLKISNCAIYSFPYIVNGAFACEMALKSSINLIEAKKCGHNLFSLFCKTDAIYQKAIKSFASSAGLEEDAFNEVLNESKNLFKDWRYYYEKDEVNIPQNFDIIVQSICLTMFKFSKIDIVEVPDK